MGEIVFVPTSDFNNYGSGDSSGFSIKIWQSCNPYTVSIQIIGPFGDYDYQFYRLNKIPFCNGTITHDGSGSGGGHNIYTVCVGANFVGGVNYDVYVTETGCSPCISEVFSFDADPCATGIAHEVNYDCATGLEILSYTCVFPPCDECTITKNAVSEVVALPLTSAVYLEEGTYTIAIGGISVAFVVNCTMTFAGFGHSCFEGVPQMSPVGSNVFEGLDYTFTITDPLDQVVHVETYVPLKTVLAPEPYLFWLAAFNIVPPMLANTVYTYTVSHTGLNALPKLTSFNDNIIDGVISEESTACPIKVISANVIITYIRCNLAGIVVGLYAPEYDKITSSGYQILNKYSQYINGRDEIYVGTGNEREIIIPWQMFGGCLTTEWQLAIRYVYLEDNGLLYYASDFPRIEIGSIYKDCFVNCPWVQYCTEDPQT